VGRGTETLVVITKLYSKLISFSIRKCSKILHFHLEYCLLACVQYGISQWI